MISVIGFDHLVLVVSDVEQSLAWYRDVLGMREVRGDEWRRGEIPFPSVRVSEETIIDFVPEGFGVSGEVSTSGTSVDHVCLVIESCDLAALASSDGIDALGPAPRALRRTRTRPEPLRQGSRWTRGGAQVLRGNVRPHDRRQRVAQPCRRFRRTGPA